jgi:hypothetical protein
MTSLLPEKMIAYRFRPDSTQPVAEKVDVPLPAADEVLVKVLAAGVCHTDLHSLLPDGLPRQRKFPPFTLGHEGAGEQHLQNASHLVPLTSKYRDYRSPGLLCSKLTPRVDGWHVRRRLRAQLLL